MLQRRSDGSRIPAGSTKAKACCQLFLHSCEPEPLHISTATGRQRLLGEGGVVLFGSLPCFGRWCCCCFVLCNVCFRNQNNRKPSPHKRNASCRRATQGIELASANNKVVFHRCVQRVPLYIFLEQRTCTYEYVIVVHGWCRVCLTAVISVSTDYFSV